jgi:hypothetical protein
VDIENIRIEREIGPVKRISRQLDAEQLKFLAARHSPVIAHYGR